MNHPVYFLVRYYTEHMTVYARGLSCLNIPELHTFRIERFYPDRADLTHRLIRLQRQWRSRRAYRKWCSNPQRLFYREKYGRFPPYSTVEGTGKTSALPSSSTN
jgi:hypothetical protein